MPGDALRQAYDTWHAEHPVDEAAHTPWHQQLKRHLPCLAGKQVLEIGCGRGGFAAWLAGQPPSQRPAHLVASDFSPKAVEMARVFGETRGVRDVSYVVGDLMALDWPDEHFDVAISCETIEHVPNPRRALAELARVLKPGGIIYLTCPNYLNLMGLHRVFREWTGRPYSEEGQPINHFLLLPRVRKWMRQGGFVMKRTKGVGHYLPFPGRPPIRIGIFDKIPFSWTLALHTLIVAARRS